MQSALAAILVFLSVTGAGGEEFWHKKKSPDWSKSDVQKILTDSPWSRPVLIPVASVGGSSEESQAACSRCEVKSGAATTSTASMPRLAEPIQAIVRWQSALPVKQALAKLRFGDDAVGPDGAAEYLAGPETAYVVGVWGVPAEAMPPDAAGLKLGAFLKIRGRPAIQAVESQAAVEQGKAQVILYFPRGDSITTADRQVEVQLKLGTLNIRRGFKLKDMVYEGKLEL